MKLWIAWGIFAVTAIICGMSGQKVIAYTMAFVSAGFGWIAFFTSD